MTLVQNLFQSNGACQDTCKNSYAFAIIQGQSCWCSNYVPRHSVDTLKCTDPCPGFPNESCGSSSSGLYAYFQLSISPSGTFARPSARPSTTPESSVSGPLTTESPTLNTSARSPSPSISSQVEALSSESPVLTVITTQSIAPASSEQPPVTVTEQASSLSPSSSV
jgi:cell wall integrity and stress response component